MTTFYTVTGAPVVLSRGASALIRAEYALIAAGFVSVNTDITLKGNITTQAWLGTHDYTGALLRSAAPVGGTDVANKTYADNLAMTAALPSQALGLVISNGTTASFSKTLTGFALNEVKGADIASAATINLTTATGNLAHVTGTTTITAITIPSGAERTVIFDGILTLTHGAALLLPGAANITTAANDRMIVRGDTAGATVVSYIKASGLAVISTQPGLILIATLTPTAAANLNFLTTFTSTYDDYVVIGDGINGNSTSDSISVQFANSGAADTALNYFSVSTTTSSTTAVALGQVTNNVHSSGKGCSFKIEIRNVNDATNIKTADTISLAQNATGTPTYAMAINGALYKGAAVSGFRLLWSGGASFLAQGTIRVYAYSKT